MSPAPTLPPDPSYAGAVRLLAALAALAAALFLLVEARDVIIPMVIALGLWLVINAVAARLSFIRIRGKVLAQGLRTSLALLLIGLVLTLAISFVGGSIAGVAADAPLYGERLGAAIAQLDAALGISVSDAMKSTMAEYDMARVIGWVIGLVTDLAGTLGIVIIYTIFLFLEQQVFPLKVSALGGTPAARRAISESLARIKEGASRYLAAKTLVAAITAAGSYVILAVAGVPNAAFFAFVIFLLNYVPTFGSLAAIALGTVVSLAAFPDAEPALITAGVLAVLQITMGNVVEPRLMSNSLNLSPLAVIMSLSVWGLIWGSVGLFLAVPMTAATAIVLSGFAPTRPIAVLLSHDGKVGG